VTIGGAVVRRLLQESEAHVVNLDKIGYASDFTSIEVVLAELGPQAFDATGQARHTLLRVDLSDAEATADAVRQADPDLVMLFFESWNQRRFDEAVGAPVTFSQDNHSCSSCGVLRGLHEQLEPEPQGKLVRCTAGAIFDVAVDLRRSSATFG
jgi:dTDP-D-glucose 4,6-dehydratase